MIKRVICMVFAIVVATSSSFAWTAESFIGNDYDDQDYYGSSSGAAVPMMLSLDDGVAVASETDTSNSVTVHDLLLNNATFNHDKLYFLSYYDSYISAADYWLDVPYEYPSDGIAIDPYELWGHVMFISRGYVNIPSVTSAVTPGEFQYAYFPWFLKYPETGQNFFEISLDVSSYNATSIELLGSMIFSYSIFDYSGSSVASKYSLPFQIFIDGNFIGAFTGELGGIIYTQSTPIKEVKIQVENQYLSVPSGNLEPMFYYRSGSTATFSFLSGTPVLDGFNDEAQDNINQHESYESQWTGSMTENFNALDLSSFTFSNGLISGFGLLTGIFNDLWHGMGDYAIVYVFPLYLAIVLLLIGRISKFGGRSGSKSDRGDSSA